MDYFKQRRAFRQFKLAVKKLTVNQASLYRELLDYANDSGLLDASFRLQNEYIMSITGIKSVDGLSTARNALVQQGLITYIKGKKNEDTPIYQIMPLSPDGRPETKKQNRTRKKTEQNAVQNAEQNAVQPAEQNAEQYFTGTDLNMTDTNHHDDDPGTPVVPDDQATKDRTRVFELWEQSFGGFMAPLIQEELRDWLKTFPADLVVEAIRRAVGNQAKWSYANAILQDWDQKKIYTVDGVKKADAMFNVGRFNKRGASQKPKTSQPPWADPNYVAPKAKPADEETKRRLAEQIAQFKKQEETKS
ncbi:DnaD domain protein [Schleiferilactobacillus perolens]|uniref:DnaD domain protein n=1 Tax=Schleiferilactobacillus perolens TaxID=100468 RepID=UPI0023573F20|nr:DnaD domain protein [Schleiferilactobacillus perolens]MCI2170659.1 DnaD domain protein [Schleiferilactobacillus perolens]